MNINNLGSINDKNLFKAVFLIGGGGSGKSFINNSIFGGLPILDINSDTGVEKYFKRNNISLIFESDQTTALAKKQGEAREKIKTGTIGKYYNAINGMLPIVLDGTGSKYDKIKKNKELLESIGYDTYLIFVNTSLEVSLKRNSERTRKVPVDIVTADWNSVQRNVKRYESLFGRSRFYPIDNSKFVTDKADFQKRMSKIANSILDNKIHNKKGKVVVNTLKRYNLKYISDIYNIATIKTTLNI